MTVALHTALVRGQYLCNQGPMSTVRDGYTADIRLTDVSDRGMPSAPLPQTALKRGDSHFPIFRGTSVSDNAFRSELPWDVRWAFPLGAVGRVGKV